VIQYPKSIEMIRLVAQALGDLNERAVYVGGATLPFYLPEQYWSQARATEDVDVVMQVVGRAKNWAQGEALRKKGFLHDMSEGAPTCRWIFKGIRVDVMSADGSVFGSTNKWYQEGIAHSLTAIESPTVRIFNLPYFIGTKLEAFKGRGDRDFQSSKDMEDIISVLEVADAQKFDTGLSSSAPELKAYLKKELSALSKTSSFLDALPGAVFNRQQPEEGATAVLNRIKTLLLDL
jgi:hypothetical protein